MTAHQVDSRWISHEATGVPFAFLSRPRQRPEAGVLVLHEAFGLNADIEALCRRLAQGGYAALACDLYWRGPDRLAGYDERSKAIEMLKSLPDVQVLADAARGLDLLREEIGGAALGALGLRIGGRYAILVASAERRRVSAAVSYYGAGIDGGRISPLWTTLCRKRKGSRSRCSSCSSATIRRSHLRRSGASTAASESSAPSTKSSVIRACARASSSPDGIRTPHARPKTLGVGRSPSSTPTSAVRPPRN